MERIAIEEVSEHKPGDEVKVLEMGINGRTSQKLSWHGKVVSVEFPWLRIRDQQGVVYERHACCVVPPGMRDRPARKAVAGTSAAKITGSKGIKGEGEPKPVPRPAWAERRTQLVAQFEWPELPRRRRKKDSNTTQAQTMFAFAEPPPPRPGRRRSKETTKGTESPAKKAVISNGHANRPSSGGNTEEMPVKVRRLARRAGDSAQAATPVTSKGTSKEKRARLSGASRLQACADSQPEPKGETKARPAKKKSAPAVRVEQQLVKKRMNSKGAASGSGSVQTKKRITTKRSRSAGRVADITPPPKKGGASRKR